MPRLRDRLRRPPPVALLAPELLLHRLGTDADWNMLRLTPADPPEQLADAMAWYVSTKRSEMTAQSNRLADAAQAVWSVWTHRGDHDYDQDDDLSPRGR